MEKKAGFTVKEASSFRNRNCDLKGMGDFEKCAQVSSALVSALAGAGVGGGLGLVSDAIRPADSDEDRKKRRISALLSGIVLGGTAGLGYDQFKKNAPLLFPPKHGRVRRIFDALDPAPSTAIAAGGLGYGLYPHFSNGGRVREWLNSDRTMFNNNPIIRHLGDHKELATALGDYNRAASHGSTRSKINGLVDKLSLGRLKPFAETTATRKSNMETLAKVVRDLLDEGIKDPSGKVLTEGAKAMESLKTTSPKFVADANRVAKSLSHSQARLAKNLSHAGRAGRGAALLAGLLALGYRATK